MTKNFKDSEWIQVADGFKFEVKIEESEDKPIIQIYQTDGNTSRLVRASILVIDSNVRLEVNQPFSGYVVIK
ncbi:hypothetical protein ACQ7CX_09630 [Chryseobacterium arthrosphaerae]|uniref:hypothetical protein n=1 Tax=Chryseobacterium arthrosphaerae TaxID=651561 RepID=UPI001BAF617F|nr:hypothetical protein [Chryseobacterium arthrosphaerae]QUY53705.1 hypothetical protein I2F65_12490 [Chryseobacterium arthrosphaerae]